MFNLRGKLLIIKNSFDMNANILQTCPFNPIETAINQVSG